MIQKRYRLAGMDFSISVPEDMIYEESFRLTPFVVEEVTQPHNFILERAEELPEPEGTRVAGMPNIWLCTGKNTTVRYIGVTGNSWKTAHSRVEDDGRNHRVLVRKAVFPGRVNVAAVLEMLHLEHLVIQNDGVILHSAYIEIEGKALLFTAPSGTGKSTQAELWKQYRGAEIINGDRVIIRIADGKILAEGIPFCGSASYCENKTLPLQAVVYLDQAPITSVRKLHGYEAFARVWEGVTVDTWNREDVERASATVGKIVGMVPVYHMPCTPDEQAVENLEKTLRKLEIQ